MDARRLTQARPAGAKPRTRNDPAQDDEKEQARQAKAPVQRDRAQDPTIAGAARGGVDPHRPAISRWREGAVGQKHGCEAKSHGQERKGQGPAQADHDNCRSSVRNEKRDAADPAPFPQNIDRQTGHRDRAEITMEPEGRARLAANQKRRDAGAQYAEGGQQRTAEPASSVVGCSLPIDGFAAGAAGSIGVTGVAGSAGSAGATGLIGAGRSLSCAPIVAFPCARSVSSRLMRVFCLATIMNSTAMDTGTSQYDQNETVEERHRADYWNRKVCRSCTIFVNGTGFPRPQYSPGPLGRMQGYPRAHDHPPCFRAGVRQYDNQLDARPGTTIRTQEFYTCKYYVRRSANLTRFVSA